MGCFCGTLCRVNISQARYHSFTVSVLSDLAETAHKIFLGYWLLVIRLLVLIHIITFVVVLSVKISPLMPKLLYHEFSDFSMHFIKF